MHTDRAPLKATESLQLVQGLLLGQMLESRREVLGGNVEVSGIMGVFEQLEEQKGAAANSLKHSARPIVVGRRPLLEQVGQVLLKLRGHGRQQRRRGSNTTAWVVRGRVDKALGAGLVQGPRWRSTCCWEAIDPGNVHASCVNDGSMRCRTR